MVAFVAFSSTPSDFGLIFARVLWTLDPDIVGYEPRLQALDIEDIRHCLVFSAA
jgi:hypothetical protein